MSALAPKAPIDFSAEAKRQVTAIRLNQRGSGFEGFVRQAPVEEYVAGLLAQIQRAEAQVVKVYEVIDREFDQHMSDRDSNCTPEQAQFYQHCEGAIAILRMRLEREVPEPGSQDEFTRASGDAICGNCNQPYKRHRFDYSELCDGQPYLNVLCDGTKVKL